MNEPLLSIRDLTIKFSTDKGIASVVNGVNLQVQAGQVHGLVGESGSGKSVTSRAVLGILPKGSIHTMSGSIRYRGRELLGLSEKEMGRDVRGQEISMVFQDPMTALNPVTRVGWQITQPLAYHKGLRGRAATAQALELLDQVGIPDPRRALKSYPDQLSGGQRQRVMIAIALACDPSLLIADEPTTALDVTVQAQILDLFDDLRRERDLGVLLVSHDLTLVAERCNQVSVMYAGRIVEHGPAKELFRHPDHPYTSMLEQARPRLENPPHTLLQTIPGTVPDLHHLPDGCPFAARCPRRQDDCLTGTIVLEETTDGRRVACRHPLIADNGAEKNSAAENSTQFVPEGALA